MSYNKFDKFLEKMSNDLAAKTTTLFLENVIHVYYDDYLYTNIKNIATLDKPVDFHKWPNSYEFAVSGIGIRAKYFFRLKHGKVMFDVIADEDYPFYNKQHRLIERMLCEDEGRHTK